MSLEIKGINNLIKKLDKLSNVKTEDIVVEAGKEVEKEVRNYAKRFSKEGYKHIGVFEPRKYGLSCYVDVGLKNENADWEEWKSLYFQHWGYWNYGLNFNGKYYIKPHQLWFDIAVKQAEESAKRHLKEELRKEVKKALNE